MSFRMGIDAGSKTIKVVVLAEDGSVEHAVYRRHRADIRTTLREVCHDLRWRFGDLEGPVAVTGSAGIALAELLHLPFVQEVIAVTEAVRAEYPAADAIVELGGEDAKIVYLSGVPEQRMNATCAGGTGGFIDTAAFMLGVRPQDMSGLSLGASRLYPIASRCAVFAQTDVRPLLNAGVRQSDIAASVREAVVRQTLSGLACGRPVKGTVVFLGGPLEHIPDLVFRFRKALGLTHETGVKPPDAHLFTARGAALMADGGNGEQPCTMRLSQIEERVASAGAATDGLDRLRPLFECDGDREAFRARHARESMDRVRLFDCEGPLYLGIDAGSTTVKLAVVDGGGRLAYSDYRPTEGDVLKTVPSMLSDLYHALQRPYCRDEQKVYLAHSAVTGYGEDLLRAALGMDSGVVETAAHLRAARSFRPGVTFVLDIGGQDMKALWVQGGLIVDAVLNEACSSGCGSFVEGMAHSLRTSPSRFAEAALGASNPVSLGTKCTVFMTSRVRHAQKMGASVADIAAGIAYSVVENALYRIIGRDRVAGMGDVVVVQGGAFKSDAVLRAFELVTGVEAIRPDTAHLMGAIGAALIGRDRVGAPDGERGSIGPRSTVIGEGELAAFAPRKTAFRCPGCTNACELSVVTFTGTRRYVDGNRCERAYGYLDGFLHDDVSDEGGSVRGPSSRGGGAQPAPNVVSFERKLLGRLSDQTGAGARGEVSVGVMNVFGLYGHLPFWHALLLNLGFSVVVADEAVSGKCADEALETIPSESVCQSAKIAHRRFHDLVRRGSTVVFMPRLERRGRCPVASWYADALRDSVPSIAENDALLASPTLESVDPGRIVASAHDRDTLLECLSGLAPAPVPLGAVEFERALEVAIDAQRSFERLVESSAERALDWVHARPGRHGIVLACRPYHVDADLIHGIDDELSRLGFAVLPPLGLKNRVQGSKGVEGVDPDVPDGWKPARRVLELARFVVSDPTLDLVFLRSFGCGYDALKTDEVRDVLMRHDRPFTSIKMDDIADTAHIRIRLRTLVEAVEARDAREGDERGGGRRPEDGGEGLPRPSGTPSAGTTATLGCIGRADLDRARRGVNADVCFTVKALAGQAIRLIEADRSLARLRIPRVCTRCLLDALPRMIDRACGYAPEILWEDTWAQGRGSDRVGDADGDPSSCDAGSPRIGVVGNALMCFDPYMNDGLVDFISRLGCRPVMPDPENLFTEDVRYLEQLDRFREMGVDHVVYLQSFGCLKGHVHSRGARREMLTRHPDMPVTVVDYDPEASALNRENRLRLALATAWEARRGCG